jgi:hypothetical protein
VPLLPTYRKDLIRRDLIQGLDISLIGSLRDDLSPGLWTEQLSDDEIWNALDVCKPDRQPFSLLGALDIALGRQHDGRYYAFAADAVQKLLKDEFPRPDGINTYELIPMLSELVLNRINSLEGGALRAPHWKRMCAWMQAGLLSRLTWTFSLDLDRFREWALGSQVPAGMYANLLDLRREPMYAAANISCEAFRHEVVGRLLALQSRHKAAGRPIPRLQEIHETMTRLAESGSTGFWSLPGPLEGHRRMVEMQGRELRNDEVRLFMEQLGEQRDGRIWPQLAHISQLFNLSETLLHQIREAIGRVRLEDKWQESKTQLEWLTLASFISAAQRDIELAKEVSGIIIAGSHLAVSENEVWMLLRTLLLAGSAFEDEDTWAEWIEEQLAEMAWRLSSGNASKAFLLYLRELKKVVKLSFCIHARAEAICSSAI